MVQLLNRVLYIGCVSEIINKSHEQASSWMSLNDLDLLEVT